MPRIWKIAPGEGASQWEMCLRRRCLVMGWKALRNYRRFGRDNAAVVRELGGGYGNDSGAARSILRFAYDVRPSDVVVANQGRSTVVGIGLISSDYFSAASPENPSNSRDYPHARKVDWIVDQPVYLREEFFAPSTVTALRPEQVNQIRRAYVRRYPGLRKTLDKLFASVLIDEEGSIDTRKLLKITKRQLEEQAEFDPKNIRDARKKVLASIVRRQGQPAFRKALLRAYDRKCAITGCAVEELLEAAHIVPYQGPKTNHCGNGILLRADLHTLFDLHLLAVDASMRVRVSPRLKGSGYEEYRGTKVRLPHQAYSRPDRGALKDRLRLFDAEG